MNNLTRIRRREGTEDDFKHYEDHLWYESTVILEPPLPKNGEQVLIQTSDGDMKLDTFYVFGLNECEFECTDMEKVFGWMSLPEPLKEDKTK